MVDFDQYYGVISYDKFVEVVSKDVIKVLNEETKEHLKKGIDSMEAHFGLGMAIRNRYI